MNNESAELLYVAYKNLIFENIKSGFLYQHVSQADYYALDKFPKLFFEVLDEFYDHYSTKDFLKEFYKANPHRDKDIEFSKEVFIRIRGEKDFVDLLERVGEDAFVDDVELLKKAFEKVEGGSLITYCGFKKLKTHQKLMEALYDSDKFSLTYFDLPAPTDDAIVKNILAKDPRSYTKLNDEQKNNKEYVLLAMGNGVQKNNRFVNEHIYRCIPEELKKCNDVALISANAGCANQPKEAFVHEGVLTNLLEAIHFGDKKENKYSRDVKISAIENIPIHAFETQRNIKELFDWIHSKNTSIRPYHENYCSLYKLIKKIAKINPYVKEQISNKQSDWIKGNISETQYKEPRFFIDYFKDSLGNVCKELNHYIMALELSQSLDKKDLKVKKNKI